MRVVFQGHRVAKKHEARVQRATLDGLRKARKDVDVKAFEKALEAGNVQAAIDALGASPAVVRRLSRG